MHHCVGVVMWQFHEFGALALLIILKRPGDACVILVIELREMCDDDVAPDTRAENVWTFIFIWGLKCILLTRSTRPAGVRGNCNCVWCYNILYLKREMRECSTPFRNISPNVHTDPKPLLPLLPNTNTTPVTFRSAFASYFVPGRVRAARISASSSCLVAPCDKPPRTR